MDAMTGIKLSNIRAHAPLGYAQRASEWKQREDVLVAANQASMTEKMIIQTPLTDAKFEAWE